MPNGKPRRRPALRVLSLGWGLDSWTLAAMSALGQVPLVDVAIHADTDHERTPTRIFAQNWTPWLEKRGIPVANVTPKDNRVIQRGAVMPPVFTVSPEGKHGMAPRQCNRDWKVRPAKRHIRKMIRERGLKLLPGTVEQWIGFHAKEAHRAERTPSRVQYITHRFPLIEPSSDVRAGIGPEEARAWLQDHNLPAPPSSSCVFCPFHDDATWEEIRRCPEDWKKAVEVDRSLRNGGASRRYTSYLHEARQPLEDVFPAPPPRKTGGDRQTSPPQSGGDSTVTSPPQSGGDKRGAPMPNTKDQWLTTATVHDEERAALWARVFPQPNRDTPTVPIVSIVPIMVELPEHDTPQQAYQLDLDAITTRQRMRLVEELADRFELEPADVDRDLDKMGVPILATDVTVSSRDQSLVMGLDVQPGMLL